MTLLTIDIPVFRQQFPAFANGTSFPDVMVQMYFDMATNYVSNENIGFLRDNSRLLAIYLMTAHLLAIADGINTGKVVQPLINATEGTVSVGFAPPPFKDGWEWWLSATPYGQQLWALLSAKSTGGFYVGGANVRAGIRKPQGWF